ncbi:hypothetical protein FIBSPDRAFT_1055694 [Athelia psychrophila]|uniref:Uncharacterized protein n=1 Tax=Athelia psychrophila TaxID=1759441 RepID=A0A167T9K9_9AGAM|nr:hypothetical protein FIBSPDRAFT_1055694 [Fibularhizoctonia sp. CBS 109695]
MAQPNTKNKGKQTKSAHLRENTGKNRPAPGALGKANLKERNIIQPGYFDARKSDQPLMKPVTEERERHNTCIRPPIKQAATVPLCTSNVQQFAQFLLPQPDIYVRCPGVKPDGYQCLRAKYRERASDDTWSCHGHPKSKAMHCKPLRVWYRRCEAITSSTSKQCQNRKSTTCDVEAKHLWFCYQHQCLEPQLDDTSSDEEEAHSHRERVELEHAEDLKNGLAERDSEVYEAERRNELKERLSELEHVYGDILQRDRAVLDRIATERPDREHVEREHPDAEWTPHRLSEPLLDDTSSDEEDYSPNDEFSICSDYDTPNTSYANSAPSSPDTKAPQVSEGFRSQGPVYESAFQPTASRIEHGHVNEERLKEPIKREPAEQEVLRWQGRAEREALEMEPLGWKRIDVEQRGGDFEGARLGVNAQPSRGTQSALATFWQAVSRATCNCAH